MLFDNSNISLARIGLCLFFALVVNASPFQKTRGNCDCRGPTMFYKELGCTPIFENPADCCPVRYNCDLWKNLPNDKCFVNGHLYSNGEELRPEDSNPCDNCACNAFQDGRFMCTSACCAGPDMPDDTRCYVRNNPNWCCGSTTYCLKEGEIRATCTVDGKTYRDGETFVPSAEPEKKCVCGAGYTGKNVEPFCISPKHTWCTNIFHNPGDIKQSCAPTYWFGTSPQKHCNLGFRCQNSRDVVIRRANKISNELEPAMNEPEDPNMLCHFGNMTMRIGDELNENTDYFSTCMKCVCEVPPTPTCQRRPECSDS